jgi:hypothetical protein
MTWWILGTGVIFLLLGIYQSATIYEQMDKQGYHWETAQKIGHRAGVIVGFGMALILAALFMMIGENIYV